LNAASKITFNEKMGKQPRLNTCRRGLFSGAKGKTFSVQTADGVVKVLGTHFNVNNALIITR
jgi:ferric-dicitrate binding protein FerR (iron transport regulator)